MIRDVDRLFPDNGCKSRSEFIGEAVEMYIGCLSAKSTEKYLSKSLLAQMNGRLEKTEARICKTIFKLAVELSMTMNIIAGMGEVDEDTRAKLRKMCLRDVKRSLGTVRFDNIHDYQYNDATEVSGDGREGVTAESMAGEAW